MKASTRVVVIAGALSAVLTAGCGGPPRAAPPISAPSGPLSDLYPPRPGIQASANGICATAGPVPAGVYSGKAAASASGDSSCKGPPSTASATYAFPPYFLAYADGIMAGGDLPAEPPVDEVTDDDHGTELCPNTGGSGVVIGTAKSPYEIRSDGTFWKMGGSMKIEWPWCRQYQGPMRSIPTQNGLGITLDHFDPPSMVRYSAVGDWLVDHNTDKDQNASWAELHEARIYAFVLPEPGCDDPTNTSQCSFPNDYYVFASGFFAQGTRQDSDLDIQVPIPPPLDPGTRMVKPITNSTQLECNIVPGLPDGCPVEDGATVSTTASPPDILAPGTFELRLQRNTDSHNGPVGAVNDFACGRECQCEEVGSCFADFNGVWQRDLGGTTVPYNWCGDSTTPHHVAHAAAYHCTWHDPPDVWECENCECDDPSSPGATITAAVQGCAVGIDPSDSSAAAQACLSACGGATCGDGPACRIGTCHPPTANARAHLIAAGLCGLPMPASRVAPSADFRVDLDPDGGSTVTVGGLNDDGSFNAVATTPLHGSVWLNQAGNELEFADVAIAADDFSIKLVIAGVTLSSDDVKGVTAYLDTRGRAILNGTSFTIPTGQLGLGGTGQVNNSAVVGTVVRNETDLSGSIDFSLGRFTLDGRGAAPNGVALQFHLSGALGNRPPTANPGPDREVPCTSPTTTPVWLDGTASTDPDPGDAISHYQWFESGVGLSNLARVAVNAGLGPHAYDLHVYDQDLASDAKTLHLKVVDRDPPALSVGPTVVCLWPPNHEYVLVRLGTELPFQVSDTCDASPSVWIDSVTSNQPDLGPGSGNTTPDVLAGTQAACLRAERQGTAGERIYTLRLKARDAWCNTRDVDVQIVVPHDMSGHPMCQRAPGMDVLTTACTAGAPVAQCVPPDP